MPLEIKGLDTFISALDKLANGIDGNVKQIVEDEANRIAGEARALAPVSGAGGGYLREKIQTRVTESEDKIVGEVYNNASYAAYVEFGTGPVGQAAGLKIDGINLTYHQTPWMIPVSKIDKSIAEKYHFIPIKEDGEVIGYLTRGQAPQPYLYPAMKNNEEHIVERLKSAVRMESKITR